MILLLYYFRVSFWLNYILFGVLTTMVGRKYVSSSLSEFKFCVHVAVKQVKDTSTSVSCKKVKSVDTLTTVDRAMLALELKKSRELAMTLIYGDGSTQLRELPQSKVLWCTYQYFASGNIITNFNITF
jgi:hypothetical protein